MLQVSASGYVAILQQSVQTAVEKVLALSASYQSLFTWVLMGNKVCCSCDKLTPRCIWKSTPCLNHVKTLLHKQLA